MINLSDTHVSIANLVDMQQPGSWSRTIEMAPYYNQIYRFGDYLVEQVQSKPETWGNPSQDVATFRVKKAGGDLETRRCWRSFEVGQVYRVLKHNDSSLVLFRQLQDPATSRAPACTTRPPPRRWWSTCATRPTPRLAGKVKVPTHDRGLLPLLVRHGRLLGRLLVRPADQLRHHRPRAGVLRQRVGVPGPEPPGKQSNR